MDVISGILSTGVGIGIGRLRMGMITMTYILSNEPHFPAFDSEMGIQYFQYRAITVPYCMRPCCLILSTPCPLYVNKLHAPKQHFILLCYNTMQTK